MKNDLFVALAVIAAVLLVSKKATATTPNTASVGNGGTMLTADRQFFYDGQDWYWLTAGGPERVPTASSLWGG